MLVTPTMVTYPLTMGQRLPRLFLFPLIITVYLIVEKVLEREHDMSIVMGKEAQSSPPRGGTPTPGLTLSWAQGSRGRMIAVFLFHVPQYAGRWFSENCSSFMRPNLFLSGIPSTLPFSTMTTSLGSQTMLSTVLMAEHHVACLLRNCSGLSFLLHPGFRRCAQGPVICSNN